MRIIKCAYSKTFPISQFFEKIYLEAELNEGDDTRKVLYDLKKQVSDFFYESNKADEKKAEVKPRKIEFTDPGFEHEQKSLEEMINSCNELKVLEGYKFIVKGKPELETIYNNRLKELT